MEILLASAVSWEIRSLLRDLRQRGSPVTGHQFPERIAYGRTRITTLSLGMGAGCSSRNLQKALDQYHPQMVLLPGFSGAVRSGQKTGDIAVLDKFSDVAKKFVTVPSLMGPSKKKEIGERWPDAFGVDLESYHLAKICTDRSIPFVCVRVVFDEMDDNLPSLRNAWELPLWYLRYRRASRSLSQAVRRVLDTLECKDSLALKESFG